MITLLFKATLAETFGAAVQLRNSIDGWEKAPVPGLYDARQGGWRFELAPERYGGGFRFKFFFEPNRWQADPELELTADRLADGAVLEYAAADLTFQVARPVEPVVDLGWAGQRLFGGTADPDTLYDVIVVGSGMAGGTLADHLSDSDPNRAETDLNVLLMEAGGFIFPTHIGNLPREQKPGVFTKHIWELWDEFAVRNYDNLEGSDYIGGQGFNLGGRSVFWGGFIPRMTSWELDFWPARVKWYLEDAGYQLAEEFMGRSSGPRTLYNRQIHVLLRRLFPDMHHIDAPVAIRQAPEGANTIGSGVFSTADVITESWLTASPGGKQGLSVLLNHQAIRVESDTGEARVAALDLRRDREVTYRAKAVVLSAGCLESARIAKRSNLPGGDLIGAGASDHPIFFTHFTIPRASPYFDPFGNVKTLSQPKEGTDPKLRAPFNMLLELGADLNHGRYLDETIWEEHLAARKDRMLCEVVFLCNEQLDPANRITFTDDGRARPQVLMRRYRRDDLRALTDGLKWRLLKVLGAQPVDGPAFDPGSQEELWRNALKSGEGLPGGVAHEVGSLRMEVRDSRTGDLLREGVVDENCRYLGLENGNVYVCDLSVFPTTPAANPSLTAVALAIRLADHLRRTLTA